MATPKPPPSATAIAASPEAEKATSPSNGSLALPITQSDLERTPAAGSSRGFFSVRPAGESGRRGFHPLHFVHIIFMSSSRVSRAVNVLWPIVPAAIAVRYAMKDNHLAVFILSYLAMVPCANLLGFAGQELARKVPHVMGVLTETT